jgi:hypothetical protein
LDQQPFARPVSIELNSEGSVSPGRGAGDSDQQSADDKAAAQQSSTATLSRPGHRSHQTWRIVVARFECRGGHGDKVRVAWY